MEDKRILEILSLKYDFHNLKTIVKGNILGRDLSNLFIYSSDNNPDKIRLQFESNHFVDTKSEFIKELKEAESSCNDSLDPQIIDIVMDRFYRKYLKSIADSLNIELFSDYVKGGIDFFNIVSILRAKKI